MRVWIFWFFAFLLLIALVFLFPSNNQNEKALALLSYFVTLAIIASLIIFDRWRNPEIYKKKKLK